jgi:hypothetical protein
MLSYGLENGCFDDYPSLGVELLALILSKERQINQNAGAGPAQLEDTTRDRGFKQGQIALLSKGSHVHAQAGEKAMF